MAALLYYLDTQSILPWAAAAAAAHELGHYLVILICGGQVKVLRLTCVGAEMALSARRPLSPIGELLSTLAGPVVNLILAFSTSRLAARWGEELYLFAGLNLGLAVFNLLPVTQLDGGRALRIFLSFWCSNTSAAHLTKVCSVAVSLALVIGGGWLVFIGQANFTLLLTALWLATNTLMPQRMYLKTEKSI